MRARRMGHPHFFLADYALDYEARAGHAVTSLNADSSAADQTCFSSAIGASMKDSPFKMSLRARPSHLPIAATNILAAFTLAVIVGTFSGSAASKTCEAPSEKRQSALAYSSGM